MNSDPESLVGTFQRSASVIIDRGNLAGLQGKVVSGEASRVLILIKAGIYVQIEVFCCSRFTTRLMNDPAAPLNVERMA